MTHWLIIGGTRIRAEHEKKQWDNLKGYLKQHKGSKATVYLKTTGDIFCRIVKLECDQNYNDLELDVNSGFSSSIRRLNSRPNNIELSRMQLDYYFNRYMEDANA
jgi:hypothetical protein